MESVNQQYRTLVATVIGVFVANTAVLFRLIARRIGRLSLTADDYLITAALLFHWGVAMGGVVMLRNGMGLPMATSTAKQLITLLKTQYSGGFTYTLCIAFTKLSIISTYLRLFQRHGTRLQIYAVAAFVIAWAIATCVACALTCLPVAKLWNPALPGRCLNLTALYYGIQIPNIVSDLMLLLIPIKPISLLNLPKPQKRSLYIIFGLGVVTLIFAIIRLVYMVQYDTAIATQDPTVAMINATVWTCIEPAVGILAACLTNMRPLLHYLARSRDISETKSTDVSGTDGSSKALTQPMRETYHADGPDYGDQARSPRYCFTNSNQEPPAR